MKKGDKFIILLLVLVALLVAASVGYRFLAERYTPQTTPMTTTGQENASGADSARPDSSTDSTSSVATESEPVMAPDFTVTDLDGNEISLSDYTGKPVIINFWATWCGPCQSEMPAFDTMYQEYGDQITFLMINVTDGDRDTVDNVRTFYEESGYSFPIYFDTTLEASITYGASSIPLTFFINPDGSIFHGQMGAMSEDFLKQVTELLLEYTQTE